MSGADLANVINEAALLTARENGTVITEAALEESVDRVVGGPRRKSRIISEHEKKITAYHEGGHTLAAWAMPDIEPVYKVTILARGRTGGHAMAVPEDDKGLMTRSEMIARLVFAMGGRAAEELVFREPTTGASSDIEQATKIARAMVTEYGMSAKLGAVRYGTRARRPVPGPHRWARRPDYSPRGRARDRRRGAQADRGRAHRGVGDPHRVPRRARHAGRRAAGEGDAAPRKDLEGSSPTSRSGPRITAFDDFGGRIPSDKPPIKTPGELAIERGEPWPPEPPSLTKPAQQDQPQQQQFPPQQQQPYQQQPAGQAPHLAGPAPTQQMFGQPPAGQAPQPPGPAPRLPLRHRSNAVRSGQRLPGSRSRYRRRSRCRASRRPPASIRADRDTRPGPITAPPRAGRHPDGRRRNSRTSRRTPNQQDHAGGVYQRGSPTGRSRATQKASTVQVAIPARSVTTMVGQH